MEDISITKDTAALLKAIHKTYKRRKRNGQSRQKAAILGDPSDIQQEIMSRWSLEDIKDACWELYEAELVNGIPGDNELQMISISNLGIAYAEGKATGAFKAVCNLIKELLPFIS